MATFHCVATGNPTPKITWIKDGKTVGLGDTLSFKANRNQSGKYWCAAENGLNSTVNASANLDVQCKSMFCLNTCTLSNSLEAMVGFYNSSTITCKRNLSYL